MKLPHNTETEFAHRIILSGDHRYAWDWRCEWRTDEGELIRYPDYHPAFIAGEGLPICPSCRIMLPDLKFEDIEKGELTLDGGTLWSEVITNCVCGQELLYIHAANFEPDLFSIQY